jgi:hypothetical protein
MLRDFALFSEKVLCRHASPWRVKAAEDSVAYLLDKTQKHFVIANEPPGVGKSTLWTHDIPLWLMCGGGFCDPVRGRAIRILLGHETKNVSIHYVERLRRLLELRRPFYDFDQGRYAEVVLVDEFGRFKPDPAQGDPSTTWAKNEFIVAQHESVDLYEKEPTVQAASRESGFLGERVEYAAWDDLVTVKTSRSLDSVNFMAEWWRKEAERRVEPGGLLWLIGQRISPNDLFRYNLNRYYRTEDGQEHPRYIHIRFPAHYEPACEGEGKHRQWNAVEGAEAQGCLLDERRLPWSEVETVRDDPEYRTVYQQEDSDPGQVLVPPVWLEGGIDFFSVERPGNYDKDRGFYEFPKNVDNLVNYAGVDPAGTGWWAVEWWANVDVTSPRYLIYGSRRKMGANMLLDWDHGLGKFVGIMEDLQQRSQALENPIRVWVLEVNAFARWLQDFDHYHRWLAQYPYLSVIPHSTQKNKTDVKLGVEALLPGLYRDGMKRIPRKIGDLEALSYVEAKKHELTTYPHCNTWDTVIADWECEFQLQLGNIHRLASRPMTEEEPEDLKLPPYLMRQRREHRR